MPRWTGWRREKGRMETGTETVTERMGRQGHNEEGNGERRRGRERGGQRGQRRKTEPVSRECENIRDGLRVGRCQLDLAPITSVMDVTVYWRQHFRGCHRPTCTWEYSKKQNWRMGYTPVGRLGIALSQRTHWADTAVESQYFTCRRRTLQWRRCNSSDWKSSGSN